MLVAFPGSSSGKPMKILSGDLLMSENSGIVFLYQPSPHPEKCLALCRLPLEICMYVTDVRLPQASPFGDPAVSRAGSRGAIVRKKTTKRASIEREVA